MLNQKICDTNRMLSLSVLLAGCMLATGCQPAERAKLVGDWGVAKPDALIGRLKSESSSAIAAGVTTSLDEAGPLDESDPADPLEPKMRIQFLGNGTLKTITEMGRVTPTPKEGRWEMLSFDSASHTMVVKCTIGLQESQHDVEFLDDDTIQMTPPNLAGLNLKLKFKRQP